MEYEVAALLLARGEIGEAMKLIDATRKRYDGTKQNPWNDIECGDHYARAMSSWSLLEAASGYRYDASTCTIGFSPTISPEHFRAPFVARDGWGTVSQEDRNGRRTLTIRLVHGYLDIENALVPGAVGGVKAQLNGVIVEADDSVDGTIAFEDAIEISAGSRLQLDYAIG
jgi:hypothetical protein